MKRKKLKQLIVRMMLYTICWRNVDKLNDLWVYDSYNIELKERNKNEFN